MDLGGGDCGKMGRELIVSWRGGGGVGGGGGGGGLWREGEILLEVYRGSFESGVGGIGIKVWRGINLVLADKINVELKTNLKLELRKKK